MRSVAKWGNSLAVRIPARLVKELGLKEGDKIDLTRASSGGIALEHAPAMTKEEALARMAARQWKLPDGYKFDRVAANTRHHD